MEVALEHSFNLYDGFSRSRSDEKVQNILINFSFWGDPDVNECIEEIKSATGKCVFASF